MEVEEDQRQKDVDEEGSDTSSTSSSSTYGVSYGRRLSAMDPLLLEMSEHFAREKDVRRMAKSLLGKKGRDMFGSSPFDPKVNNFWPKLAHKLMCQWCKQRQEADADDKRSNDLIGLLGDLNRDDLLTKYWDRVRDDMDKESSGEEPEEGSEKEEEEDEEDNDSDSSDDITPPAKRQKPDDHEVWIPPPLMPYLTWHCMKMIADCFGDNLERAKDMGELMLDRGNELLLHRLATKPGRTTQSFVLDVLDVYRRQHGNGDDCVSLLRLALNAEFKMTEAADCLLLT